MSRGQSRSCTRALPRPQVRASALLHGDAVAELKCPLCGAIVAGAWSAAKTDAPTVLGDRITTLTRRISELEHGELTPREIKDETLWLCAECQRLMTDQAALDGPEIQRRIREHVRQLERRVDAMRHAS